MSQEDIQMLFKDLCARLPYGVKVWYKYYPKNVTEKFATSIRLADGKIALSSKFNREGNWYLIEEANELLIKPYLRPLLSMTEEEARDIAILHGNKLEDILSIKVTDEYIDIILDDGVCGTITSTIWYDEIVSSVECFDYLNKHMFDYRGLISKDLAIYTEEFNPYLIN